MNQDDANEFRARCDAHARDHLVLRAEVNELKARVARETLPTRPEVQTWWLPPLGPDMRDEWFAIARCCVHGKEHGAVLFYHVGMVPHGFDAMDEVKRDLIDRLITEGVLSCERSRFNPFGEPMIL